MKSLFTGLAFILVFASSMALAQDFSVDEYKKFLKDNENLSTEDFYNLYPFGKYRESVSMSANPLYLDTIGTELKLTDYEKQLINKHGFMVSERLRYSGFFDFYADIYHLDLPTVLTTDLFLHAIHKSYDNILKSIEINLMVPKLKVLLKSYHEYLPRLESKYGSNPEMKRMLLDYDLYFTVARNLADESVVISPYFPENQDAVNSIMGLVNGLSPAEYNLFSDEPRAIDFSQFKIRGHYVDKEHPELGSYFQAMIWLGRTELYLIKPSSKITDPDKPYDMRQTVDSYLMLEATDALGLWKDYETMDNIVKAMVGESDNVKLNHLKELLTESGLTQASDFLDKANCKKLSDILKNKPYSDQKILSQMLLGDPFGEPVQPASAFMLFGQRFIIDSYILSNVVYDRIKTHRMLPSTLDVLFALGNNAASDLLETELKKYNYAVNLAGLRYLVDSYHQDFWDQSMFNCWLNIIRTLKSPQPEERKKLPEFMQTAAWAQEKMNTQLASWAELRHDNLLYAKQSYSAVISCSFPYIYVEANPDFFIACKNYASIAFKNLEKALPEDYQSNPGYWQFPEYLKKFADISDKLASISRKELDNELLSADDNAFLKKFLRKETTNGDGYTGTIKDVYYGWFFDLFYNEYSTNGYDPAYKSESDFLVADVHTAPEDENGNPAGYVLHVGTGYVNGGVIVARNADGSDIAYTAPMMSYYENLTTGFQRLTDQDWESLFDRNELSHTIRPSFVDLYLAGNDGEARSTAPVSLPLDDFKGVPPSASTPNIQVTAWPNPSSDYILFAIVVPQGMASGNVSLTVYDINGIEVARLFNGSISGGNYIFKWNGLDPTGRKLASGAYVYKLVTGSGTISGKVIFNW